MDLLMYLENCILKKNNRVILHIGGQVELRTAVF